MVHLENGKRSCQWIDHDEEPIKVPELKLRQQKIMLTVKWSPIGVIHYSFLESDQKITAKFYYQLAEMHNQLIKILPAQSTGSKSATCQCLITCYQNDTAEVHQLEIRDLVTFSIFPLSLANFSSILIIFKQKKIPL